MLGSLRERATRRGALKTESKTENQNPASGIAAVLREGESAVFLFACDLKDLGNLDLGKDLGNLGNHALCEPRVKG